jgi:hypothetical protein
MEEEEEEVSWLEMPYHAPVLDAAGNHIGRTESLLGDEQADIFHGIVIKLSDGGELREVPSSSTTKITRSNVQTAIPPGDTKKLEPYHEQHWFHLGWGGLFRRRPEWEEGER